MKFHVLTLFPELIENGFNSSVTGRALSEGTIELNIVNIRDHSADKHHKVDDYPYGGGAGMLMFPQPVYDAYLSLNVPKKTRVVYMCPQGECFSEQKAIELSKEEQVVFLCGHYEGIDERVLEEIVTDRISIGDYVLTGGELPSLVVMDAVSRMVPGVLGNNESKETESFYDDLLEYPQYTRPPVWNGREVPSVILSGDHKKVEEYRLEKSLEITKEKRPDLYEKWSKKHPEYFEKLEKKRKREEAKKRKLLKKEKNS